jgi:large subunit ribosomal protein L4e
LFQAASRPLVTVYDEKGQSTGKSVVLPAVFRAPIRTDIVDFVHDQMRRNKRQAHAVSDKAGQLVAHETESFIELMTICITSVDFLR